MVLSQHNDQIWSSNQVPIVIIDNVSRESYLLATLEHSGLLYFPLELPHNLQSLIHYLEL
jgi:hypothetical protein